jgi:hypothetical protein
MGYFLKELTRGNKTYWIAVCFIAGWTVAIIDAISSAIKPPGLANGYWAKTMFLITFLAFLSYIIYRSVKEKRTKSQIKTSEEDAAAFEPIREEQIRHILEENPSFTTHCYECIHFNPDLKHCSKNLSQDISQQRIKEIKIKGKYYCLYWQESLDIHPDSDY